jgi:hypothetical protein
VTNKVEKYTNQSTNQSNTKRKPLTNSNTQKQQEEIKNETESNRQILRPFMIKGKS